MFIRKCDICKKIIKDFGEAIAVHTKWENFDMCDSCKKPIIKFLKKGKLVEQKVNIKVNKLKK